MYLELPNSNTNMTATGLNLADTKYGAQLGRYERRRELQQTAAPRRLSHVYAA
jgi:hypothetical protein